MKLQHGLGGLEGLESFPLVFDKRVFAQDWEKRIFGIHTAMMGLSSSLRESVAGYDLDAVPTTFHTTWTWAHLRSGAEAMHPFEYFKYRYYEKWLGGITAYLVEQGYVTEAELDAATSRFRAEPAAPLPDDGDPAVDDQVLDYLRRGDSPRRGPAEPVFAVGDDVVVRNPPATDHTRLPGYLRGHRGRVQRVFEGNYSYFVSTGGDGLGEPMPVYVVRFEPQELWGEETERNAGPLYAELYQVYLSEAKGSR
ncbi:nitrile hydratase subunit beta [Amycolatopsis sp. FDAARGOS 1241]|uniref:nitrile hydratase subunit beta n=1 Tax=Amycolatopsis sp. FDAARGOS 1241 TaxID=2778070 RepID=UPI00195078A4|nr:nitrile hydratase subunit beta [Amycolatopsis sp. FDAARGOS 1241]QRP47725.1 nitrile hydratase subunit beta [Amycolatopsis sp. FDAARGOS 1241]